MGNTYLLFVVLADVKHLPDILQAWRDIGVPGVTIMEGAGAFRATTWLSEVGLGAVDRLFDAAGVRRRALLAAIDDEKLLERAIAEADRLVGGFENPDTGVLLVLPVLQTRGLQKKELVGAAATEAPPPAPPSEWVLRRDTLVDEVVTLFSLEPIAVPPAATLDEVARAFLAQPNVPVVCVEGEDGRLVGLLDLETVAEDLFFYVLPEEFLSEVVDLEQALAFAEHSRMRTAADHMKPPVWVKLGETVKEAFRRMHDNHLLGLPVVNETYCVVGFINLLELLSIFITQAGDAAAPGRPRP